MPPNFSHPVSFSRRRFSLARIFFFRHDFLFSAPFFFRHGQDRSPLTNIIRELKQRRFWATHVNRKCASSLFIYLDCNKFVLLSFFSLIMRIYSRVSTKPLPNDAKRLLPVEVRRAKTLLLKLPIVVVWSTWSSLVGEGWGGGVIPYMGYIKVRAAE